MKSVGQCIGCGTNLVKQARVWVFAKESTKPGQVASLYKQRLASEFPQEARRFESEGPPADEFRCPSCGVLYPREIWTQLARALSSRFGSAKTTMSSTPGTPDSRAAHELAKLCRNTYDGLQACPKCKTAYRGSSTQSRCPNC
jgi:hypothetical protein